MKDCPCGTGFPYTDCCGPLIRGTSPADTAEDLMRSRYSAFALEEWAYLDKTLHPDEDFNNSLELNFRRKNINWTKLEFLGSSNGGSDDTEGEVAFAAHFRENGESKVLRENSKFFRVSGKWFYSQSRSTIFSSDNKGGSQKATAPIRREGPKVGRNNPCPCGSRKKFKKCCGKG